MGMPLASRGGSHPARGKEHSQPPEVVTYLLAPTAVQEFLNFLEPEDGMLHPMEEGALPGYGTCHRGVVLVQWWVVQVLHKDLINDVYLKSKWVPWSACHRPCPADMASVEGGILQGMQIRAE